MGTAARNDIRDLRNFRLARVQEFRHQFLRQFHPQRAQQRVEERHEALQDVGGRNGGGLHAPG
jgi:hypothetical protein